MRNLTINNALTIAAAIFGLDQSVKFALDSSMGLYSYNTLIDGFITIKKVYNTGAAFSVFENHAGMLAIISTLAAICVVLYLYKEKQNLNNVTFIGWSLVLGGIFGNLFDRIVHGHVIDYISLDFINFPIFNIADVAINLGAFTLILYILFFEKRVKTNE